MIIKKTTLALVAIALILAGGVYYFDWKRGSEEKASPPKRAYAIQASDVVSITLAHPTRPSEPAMRFAKRDGSWQVVEPIESAADQATLDGLCDQIAGANISETEPGTPDRLKAFGLDPPRASLEFQLASGAMHTLLVGNKTFTGDSVYAIVDGSQQVSLLPVLLATSTGKSLDTLRDRFVLHFDTGKTASFTLKNPSGELAASKENDRWKISKPSDTPASQEAVESLLQSVRDATLLSVASEKPDDLGRYGLSKPVISFSVTDQNGAQNTLLVGRKDGDAYFAHDVSRPTIFRINEDVYKKLSEKFADLRDKKVLHLDAGDLQAMEIHNTSGSISLRRKQDNLDDWVFDAPADQKGKTASSWKVLDPLMGLTAEEVIDHPAPNLLALEANPAVTAQLTSKDGKPVVIKISKASGDFAYAQVSGNSALYKLKKDVLDTLNVKAADLVP
jgi:Domain of unknown function (DUF4340)